MNTKVADMDADENVLLLFKFNLIRNCVILAMIIYVNHSLCANWSSMASFVHCQVDNQKKTV